MNLFRKLYPVGLTLQDMIFKMLFTCGQSISIHRQQTHPYNSHVDYAMHNIFYSFTFSQYDIRIISNKPRLNHALEDRVIKGVRPYFVFLCTCNELRVILHKPVLASFQLIIDYLGGDCFPFGFAQGRLFAGLHKKSPFLTIFLFTVVWNPVNIHYCMPAGKHKPPAGDEK